ncbi:MAG: hypothetical protein IPP52_06570 [Ignavibacteria bacterium]|nr:hypothetical protein [Ignavibacteria bacterium]
MKNNVLYVGTFDGILKSTDSGNNWVTSFSGSTVTSLAYNNNFIFGGKVNGIILSSDNGNTWIPSNNGLTNLNINVLRTDGINIYAGTFGGLFQSINNGANWNLISQNFPIPINDLIAFGDTIFAAASGAGIYMTSNGGLNWAHISNVIPYTNPVSLSKSNNKLLASFYGGGIYSTTDNGMTWTKSNNNLPLLPIVQTLLAGDSLTFAGCFGNGLYKSLTKEFNWENSNKGLFATTILSMETCSRGLLVGSNKGMYLTSDGGQNWVSASSFMECNYISSIVKYGYNIYAGTIGGCGMMKSTDEGLTWFPINNGLSNFTINNITISNNLIFAATNEGIFYSNNFGLSWSLVSSLPLTSYFGIKFLDSDLYASNSDIIYKSTNLGQNWNQVSDGIPAGSRIKNFERFQNKIYASGDLGVFFSTDSGTSWISSNNGLGDNFIYSFIKLGNHLVLSTIFGGIYYSSNAGQNWLPLNNGLPSKTLSLFSIDSILYAGTQGDGVYKINFNTVGINTTSSFVPKIFQLYQTTQIHLIQRPQLVMKYPLVV